MVAPLSVIMLSLRQAAEVWLALADSTISSAQPPGMTDRTAAKNHIAASVNPGGSEIFAWGADAGIATANT
jgi:hypothetical protein